MNRERGERSLNCNVTKNASIIIDFVILWSFLEWSEGDFALLYKTLSSFFWQKRLSNLSNLSNLLLFSLSATNFALDRFFLSKSIASCRRCVISSALLPTLIKLNTITLFACRRTAYFAIFSNWTLSSPHGASKTETIGDADLRHETTSDAVLRHETIGDAVLRHETIGDAVLRHARKRLVCNRHPPWHVVPTHFSPFHLSQFFEGYGQTETTSVISHSVDIDMTSGHVGVPGGDMEVKLIDVPDLDYHAKDDQGEVKDLSFNHLIYSFCCKVWVVSFSMLPQSYQNNVSYNLQ